MPAEGCPQRRAAPRLVAGGSVKGDESQAQGKHDEKGDRKPHASHGDFLDQ